MQRLTECGRAFTCEACEMLVPEILNLYSWMPRALMPGRSFLPKVAVYETNLMLDTVVRGVIDNREMFSCEGTSCLRVHRSCRASAGKAACFPALWRR